MKTLLRNLLAATVMAAAAVAVQAQTRPIVYGRTTITNSDFLKYVASFAVTVTDLAGNPIQNDTVTFIVREGAIDLATAAGEVTHAGGYLLSGNGNSVRIQDLVLETTTSANPTVTALFVVNGKLLGRLALYQAKASSGIKLPLQPQNGTEQINGIGLTLASAAAVTLNNALIITEPVLQAGEAAGTASLYAALSANNSDE